MAGRQAVFSRQIGDRRVAIEMSFDERVRPPNLPGRKPRADRREAGIQALVTTAPELPRHQTVAGDYEYVQL
jgi:hypothetical protein